MDNTSKNIITPFDLTLLIVGSMCGIRVLHASNQVAEIAKQDGAELFKNKIKLPKSDIKATYRVIGLLESGS